MLSVGDEFPTMNDARNAIRDYALDDGDSFKVYKSDTNRHIVICNDAHCSFRIRASVLQSSTIRITIMNPHSCSPATRFDNMQASSIVYLLDYYRESVIANQEIT